MSDDKTHGISVGVGTTPARGVYAKDAIEVFESMVEKKKDHRLIISENPFEPSPEDRLTLLYRKLGLTPDEVQEEYDKIKRKESRLSSDMRRRVVLFVEQIVPRYR